MRAWSRHIYIPSSSARYWCTSIRSRYNSSSPYPQHTLLCIDLEQKKLMSLSLNFHRHINCPLFPLRNGGVTRRRRHDLGGGEVERKTYHGQERGEESTRVRTNACAAPRYSKGKGCFLSNVFVRVMHDPPVQSPTLPIQARTTNVRAESADTAPYVPAHPVHRQALNLLVPPFPTALRLIV